MASDSIIARPMNSVRVMARSASGWRASASSACVTARPMATAGSITPSAIAISAAAVDTMTSKPVAVMVPYSFRSLVDCWDWMPPAM